MRALVSGEVRDGVPEVVLLPGLGAPGYMLDLLHACGAWTRARLLDLPGFGSPRTADCPRELVVTLPSFVRAGAGLPRYIRSALADEPERHVPEVRAPLLVLRGRHDALCPPGWAADLAGRARSARLVTVPGAHNTPYTHPGAVALHLGALAHER